MASFFTCQEKKLKKKRRQVPTKPKKAQLGKCKFPDKEDPSSHELRFSLGLGKIHDHNTMNLGKSRR